MRLFQILFSRYITIRPYRYNPPLYLPSQFPPYIVPHYIVFLCHHKNKPILQHPNRGLHIRLVFYLNPFFTPSFATFLFADLNALASMSDTVIIA
jgi:hypothetical protein